LTEPLSADIDKQTNETRRRDKLIETIEEKLKIGYTKQVLFEIEWRLRRGRSPRMDANMR
jgi:hypothetical protein